MLELALRTRIPFIGIRTDDVINVVPILQLIAGQRKLQVLPVTKGPNLSSQVLYYTMEESQITPDWYERLEKAEAQCIAINLPKNALVFDGGTLLPPTPFIVKYLKGFVAEEAMDATVRALAGLSLKALSEVVQITMVRTAGLKVEDIRRTRMIFGGDIPGLQPIKIPYDFYDMPQELQEWLDLNRLYYPTTKAPQRLVPRGVLLNGPTGVGKSLAAQVIANAFQVPLYRIDIAGMLNKYIGNSESRFAQALAAVEADSPCVLLFDEIEKLFGGDGDEGTPNRLLSMLLWWLQEHRFKIITVMTTNDFNSLPLELYRPGRIDRVIQMPSLPRNKAIEFVGNTYESLLGPILPEHKGHLFSLVEEMYAKRQTQSHAYVTEKVYELIKAGGWGLEKIS